MQRTMFDPREAPTATAEMLADRDLRGAIAAMRRRNRVKVVGYWPYVEAIEGGVKAWAVDDRGVRFVVVGSMVFEMADFEILNRKVQKSASDVFVRLDAGVAAMSKRDDTRILVALREQYVVAFHWHGTERPRFSHDIIEHPDGRRRYVAHTACRRLYGAGLIVNDGWTPPCDYGDWSEPYRLTAAGQAAAGDPGRGDVRPAQGDAAAEARGRQAQAESAQDRRGVNVQQGAHPRGPRQVHHRRKLSD
jgi:hypothetical protein